MAYLVDLAVLRAGQLIERWDARRRGGEPDRSQVPGVLAPGVTVAGRYLLTRLLGEGGMGRVWMAQDTLEKRPVAFKEMRTPPDAAPIADVAFKREFYTMTKLQHPNTVKVFDYGVLESGDRFLTMEVVQGTDLSTLLARGTLELDRVYRILMSMAHVLGFIHSRLYVHCDIKSENVRWTDAGAIKLMDFGLMHQLGTPVGESLKGTAHYMAPEIPKGGVIDARTDLYSLGVLAFELAAGRYPFEGRTLLEILSQHLERQPPSLRHFREVPERFDAVVQRLLAKDPKERYQSTAELLPELAALAGESVEVRDYGSRVSYLHCAELVGRDGEQQALREALAAVREGRGRSLFVTAPAGVGKTRLLQEFRLAVKIADVPLYTGFCRAEGQAPLGPLNEALGQLLPHVPRPVLDRVGPLLARTFAAVAQLGYAPAPGVEKGQIFEALRELLRETAEATPFILCLEDLHWADAVTLEYLNVVLRELHQRRAMVLGTFRSNEVDRLSLLFQTVDEGLTARMELPPLTEEGTRTLVESMLGGGTSPEFLLRLHHVTAGNAFFVTETLRAFIEEGVLENRAGTWVTTAPADQVDLAPSIEDVVRRRLATLPEKTLGICRKLAPIGRVLDLRVVSRVAGLPDKELFRVLDELVERQFIQRVEDDFYFAHDTVRSGIYAATPELERRIAHQEIAQALEAVLGADAEQHAAALGYHFSRGDDRLKAIHYLLIAADEALARQMMLRGAELLAQSADLIEAGEYRRKVNKLIELWARIVEIAMTAHPPTCIKYADKLFALWAKRMDLAEGARTFQEASRRVARDRGLFRARRRDRLWAEAPLEPDSRDPLHVMPRFFLLRSMQAIACASTGNPRLKEIIERQYADNPDPGPFRASAYVGKGISLLNLGHWEVMETAGREALGWFEQHLQRVGTMPRELYRQYAMTAHFVTLSQAMSGRPLDGEIWGRGIALCDRYGFPDIQWFLRASPAAQAAIAGDPVGMAENYGRLVDINRRLGHPQMQESRLTIWVGVYWIQREERELSEAIVRKFESWRERLPHDTWMRRYAQTHRAMHLVTYGAADAAEQAVEEALAAAREAPSFRLMAQLLCARARLLGKLGRGAEAQPAAEEALELATRSPTAGPWDEMVARRTLAELLEGDAAVAQASEAVALARRWGQPLHEGLAELALARIHSAQRPAAAAEAWNRAVALLEGMKATELLQKAAALRQRAAG